MKVSFVSTITMRELWMEYADRAYEGVELSQEQYCDTRMAFYAGAWTALNKIIKATDGDQSLALLEVTKLFEDVIEFLEDNMDYIPIEEIHNV